MLSTLESAGDPIDLLSMLFSEKRERTGRPWAVSYTHLTLPTKREGEDEGVPCM